MARACGCWQVMFRGRGGQGGGRGRAAAPPLMQGLPPMRLKPGRGMAPRGPLGGPPPPRPLMPPSAYGGPPRLAGPRSGPPAPDQLRLVWRLVAEPTFDSPSESMFNGPPEPMFNGPPEPMFVGPPRPYGRPAPPNMMRPLMGGPRPAPYPSRGAGRGGPARGRGAARGAKAAAAAKPAQPAEREGGKRKSKTERVSFCPFSFSCCLFVFWAHNINIKT